MPPDTTCTKNDIAAHEGLTPGYVQQLMGTLQTAGLVTSVRGKQGGFRLARPPESITVAEALRATEGEIRLAPCHDGENCERIPICPTRPVWVGAAKLLGEFFNQVTIARLADESTRDH
jgi:Rrf2 family protein